MNPNNMMMQMIMNRLQQNNPQAYSHCSHQGCKDLYYTLAMSHHDMYGKIRTQIATEVNRLTREHPEMHADVIVTFLRDTEDELVDRIKRKLGR